MDPFTQKLLERTRERREKLAEKMGTGKKEAPVIQSENITMPTTKMEEKTMDSSPRVAPPRKRRTPLSDDLSENIQNAVMESSVKNTDDDSPNKRKCYRETENSMKPDTPAILGVKSRLAGLAARQSAWNNGDDTMDVENAPSPTRNQATISPPPMVVGSATKSARKGRFAALAANINGWEDDLSHPSHRIEDDAAPVKPPRTFNESVPAASPAKPPRVAATNSPMKSNPVQSPARSSPARNPHRFVSPNKGQTEETFPAPSRSPSPIKKSDNEARHVSTLNVPIASTKSANSVKQITMTTPKTEEPIRRENEPTDTPVVMRRSAWESKSAKKEDNEPTKRPVSARMADWETKVRNPQPAQRPKTTYKATPGRLNTPARPDNAVPQLRKTSAPVNNSQRTTHQAEEPTEKSIMSRMACWEQKASTNPNSVPTPQKGAVGVSLATGASITPKKLVERGKSFSEKIAERAKDLQTPNKSPTKIHSPVKMTQGVKNMQENLKQQMEKKWQDNEIADKIRQQKDADMDVLNTRWQNFKGGPVTSTSAPAPAPPAPPAPSAPVQEPVRSRHQTAPQPKLENDMPKPRPRSKHLSADLFRAAALDESIMPEPEEPKTRPPTMRGKVGDKREAARNKVRQDFESKLKTMGFAVESNADLGHVAKINLKKGAVKISKGAQPGEKIMEYQVETTVETKNGETRVSSKVLKDNTSTDSGLSREGSFRGNADYDTQSETGSERSNSRQSTSPSSSEYTVDDSIFEAPRGRPYKRQDSFSSQQSLETDCSEYTNETADESYDEQETTIKQRVADSYDESESEASSTYVSLNEYRRQTSGSKQYKYVPRNVPAADYSTTESDSDFVPSHSFKYQTKANQQVSTSHGRHDFDPNETEIEAAAGEIDDLLDEVMSDTEDDIDPKKYDTNFGLNKQVSFNPDGPNLTVISRDNSSMDSMSSASDSSSETRHQAYSLSSYRSTQSTKKQPVPAPRVTVVRRVKHESSSSQEDEEPLPFIPEKNAKEKIQELQQLVNGEQSVIMQTSNALNKCCGRESSFAGSAEQVECNRLLLIACQKRQSYLAEIQKLKEGKATKPHPNTSKGSLSISDMRLPLKKDFLSRMGTSSDKTVHYFLCLLRNGPHVIATQMVSTHDAGVRASIDFPNLINIKEVHRDFKYDLEIYSMSVTKEIQDPKKSKSKTPKKLFGKSQTAMPSPGGPYAVRTTSFTCIATLPLTMDCLNHNCFTLNRVPYSSPLHGTIYLRLRCMFEINVEERGFLTMFEDVSGFGAWHRRWCVLRKGTLRYWKYPDDENHRDPMGIIDLKRCITDSVGLIPRDICARPHTFELVSIRPQQRGERNSLISQTYNTMTTTRHQLSADTKEDRILWCKKVNEALENVRAWHPDAMRPIKRKTNPNESNV
ncbi:unnamed protein product [Owenia fusiformis]|uniref:Uncharacterized protein n=1 Tax=Owenia fusiformis TaxID=6347 RepID=A0A8J1Y7I5_OWEFU|nr:unnamed protein product [Owenia fusiformis]